MTNFSKGQVTDSDLANLRQEKVDAENIEGYILKC